MHVTPKFSMLIMFLEFRCQTVAFTFIHIYLNHNCFSLPLSLWTVSSVSSLHFLFLAAHTRRDSIKWVSDNLRILHVLKWFSFDLVLCISLSLSLSFHVHKLLYMP